MKTPDLSRLDEIADNDLEFKHSLIEIIQKEFFLEKNMFLEVFEQKKLQESAAIVHKLKHKINLLNLDDGYKIATSFENQLLEGSTGLFSDFVIVLNTIDKFLKRKKYD